MTCPICRHGEMEEGFTTVFFEIEKSTIIIKEVPASICDNCNESFVSEEISRKLLSTVNNEAKKGVEVEIIHYAA